MVPLDNGGGFISVWGFEERPGGLRVHGLR